MALLHNLTVVYGNGVYCIYRYIALTARLNVVAILPMAKSKHLLGNCFIVIILVRLLCFDDLG